MRREKLESAAIANFAVLLNRQSATVNEVLANLLDVQSPWCWEEQQQF